ncbi:MAG: hypothetical protein KF894_04160 [Labilithrix sp.]|nr:hypothetical protein [Labilithrix sp.]
MIRRWVPLLALVVVLVHAVAACMGGDDALNPQPLPPQDPTDQVDDGRSDNPTTGENGGSSSGGAAPTGPLDAGTSPDADGGEVDR